MNDQRKPARKRLIRRLGALAGLFAVVGFLIAAVRSERALPLVLGPIERTRVAFATLTPSQRPNWYLVCPESYCAAAPHRSSPVFDEPASSLRDRWMRMVARHPRIRLISEDVDGLQFVFEQRSLVLRFPDTITVRFIALDGGRATLAIYSRSHYGYGDFGVNRQRIESWLASLSDSP